MLKSSLCTHKKTVEELVDTQGQHTDGQVAHVVDEFKIEQNVSQGLCKSTSVTHDAH